VRVFTQARSKAEQFLDAWGRYLPCCNIPPSLSPETENQNIGTSEKDQGVECSKIVPVAGAGWNTGTDQAAGSGVPGEITEQNVNGTANTLKYNDCSNVSKNTALPGEKRVIRI
jgi:hypothetical protein